MSKDIRVYFGNSKVKHVENDNKIVQSKKRNRRILDSDEDEDNDFVVSKSDKKKHKHTEQSSGINNAFKHPKNSEVMIEVENFFGSTPIKQKKQTSSSQKNDPKIKKTPERVNNLKSKQKNKSTKHEDPPIFECDDELEASILQTDDELLVSNALSTDTCNIKYSIQKEGCRNSLNSSDVKEKWNNTKQENLVTPAKDDVKHGKTPVKEEVSHSDKIVPNSDHKRKNAEAYQKYLHRSGPKNPGSKQIPQGSPACFQGLAFVVTGILESLEREEAINLIQKYGGRVTGQVSKKTNFIVIGEEPGASKIEKAKKYGTKKLNEDELLHLIIEKSGVSSMTKDNFIEGTPEKSSKYFDSGKKLKRPRNLEEKPLEQMVLQAKIQRNERNDHRSEPESTKLLTGTAATKPDQIDSVIMKTEKKHSPLKMEITTDNDHVVIGDSPSKSDHTEDMLWVDKYKPKSTKGIVGQGGEKSNVKKLIYWLQNWYKNHSGNGGKKPSRPAPWAQNDDGSYYKAALISGPPGIGKTTSVHLVCQELGMDIIEFNASDTRSKCLLQEEVSQLLTSKSLHGYLQDSTRCHSNHVLVMDEVDGMAGNEDRGGMQELIQLIKNTKIPIIGICNDRNQSKMRSLVNYCFDLRFQRPPVKQIKAAMLSVCFKENIKISGESLEELIVSSNHDLRQVLHRLSLLTFSDKILSLDDAKKDGVDGKKPLNLGPWDVIRKVFSASDQENIGLSGRMDLFFQDYSLGPLFVQDSYLNVRPHKARNSTVQALNLISKTAESIALGDVVERTIRNKNSWNLLPVQAVFSSVLPGYHMAGNFTGKIEFPVWLGKNSRTKKMSRIIQELYTSLSTCISGDGTAVNLDYLPSLKYAILRPLIQKGSDGVQDAVKFMVDYGLVREDLDHILELSAWPGVKDIFSSVDSKVKAAFTRALNKECQRVSYVTKKVGKASGDQLDHDQVGEEMVHEEDDTIDLDPMIKKGKPKKPGKGTVPADKVLGGGKKETAKKLKSKEKK
ncbi:hypothetical protein RUM44_005409 [Polyplax serrata]|uniref:Replication factor C subunit 1 n=1 Tax=Polyplax serrata TaxID=468196 RepID=A0ABR1ADH5_POLSC